MVKKNTLQPLREKLREEPHMFAGPYPPPLTIAKKTEIKEVYTQEEKEARKEDSMTHARFNGHITFDLV